MTFAHVPTPSFLPDDPATVFLSAAVQINFFTNDSFRRPNPPLSVEDIQTCFRYQSSCGW
jgi:hypothetical protein